MNALKIKELSEKRGELVEQQRAILSSCEKRGKDMTKDEQKQYDAYQAAIDAMTEQLRGLESAEDVARKQAFAKWTKEKGGESNELRSQNGGKGTFYAPNEQIYTPEANEERTATVGQVIRAKMFGPRNEAEERALSEGTDSAGGVTVPKKVASQFFDVVRAKSQMIQAGAGTVVMDESKVTFAKVLTDPAVAWRNENASVAESDPTFGPVEFVAKSLAVLVPVSNELIADSVNIDQILQRVLSSAIAAELDRAGGLGSGTPPEPQGLRGRSGLQTIAFGGTNGGAITNYDVLLDAWELLLGVNASPTAAIMSPRSRMAFARLKDTTNQPLQRPEIIQNFPLLETAKIPNNVVTGSANNTSPIFIGDFTQLMFGIRQQLVIEINRSIRMDKLQTLFVAHMRADVAVSRENHFVQINGVKPA